MPHECAMFLRNVNGNGNGNGNINGNVNGRAI
jgi:hypothetical protein